MRYFIVTYSFIDHRGRGFGNLGFRQPKGFLNRKQAVNWIAKETECKSSDIILLTLLEVTESDYEDYFRED